MKKPNLFVIGAPKCGTTALASYLAAHPNIFMSDPKEPHHYNTDINHGIYKDKKDYLALFKDVGQQHHIVGEASVWYMYSVDAVPNILRENPNAKFIAMLRNPVEMAHSLHEQAVFTGVETVTDFERAWRLQEERARGDMLPIWCPEKKILLYRDACSIGTQYERVTKLAPTQNLLPILYDDFKHDPRKVWGQVMDFLGLVDDGRQAFPVINAAKERRSIFVQRATHVYDWARRRAGFRGFGTGFFTALGRWNIRERSRASLSENMRNELINAFSEEVSILERSLGRGLSEWRK